MRGGGGGRAGSPWGLRSPFAGRVPELGSDFKCGSLEDHVCGTNMVTWNTHWRTPITRPTSSPNFCFTSVCNSRKHAWSLQPAQSKLYPTLVQHWTQWLLVKDWHSWPFSLCLSLTGEHWWELMRYVQPASFSCKSNSMSCRALKKEGNVRGNCNVLLVENPAAVGMAQSRFTFLIRSSIISISGKFPRGPMSLWAYDPLGPNHYAVQLQIHIVLANPELIGPMSTV